MTNTTGSVVTADKLPDGSKTACHGPVFFKWQTTLVPTAFVHAGYKYCTVVHCSDPS